MERSHDESYNYTVQHQGQLCCWNGNIEEMIIIIIIVAFQSHYFSVFESITYLDIRSASRPRQPDVRSPPRSPHTPPGGKH